MADPSFFVIGAPKCGTTALHTYLAQHPDVFMGPKERHFFAPDVRARPLPRDQYLQRFSGSEGKARVGEASVFYLYSTDAAEAIWRFNPEALIIAMLRHPVDLVYSLHSQLLFAPGHEDIEDFETALAAEPFRMNGGMLPARLSVPPKLLFYRQILQIHTQLKRYFDLFGRRNVHVILYDDFKRDTAGAFDGVCDFLGIPPCRETEFRVVNPNKKLRSRKLTAVLRSPPRHLVRLGRMLLPARARKGLVDQAWRLNVDYRKRPPLSPALRERLTQEFEPIVEGLEKLLDRDLRAWKSGSAGSSIGLAAKQAVG